MQVWKRIDNGSLVLPSLTKTVAGLLTVYVNCCQNAVNLPLVDFTDGSYFSRTHTVEQYAKLLLPRPIC
jgi:hypothetical protein